jgi:hypothetical protein
MATKLKKDRLSYLINSIQTHNLDEPTWNDSIKSPAVYFLTQVVNLNKSLRYCMGQFPSKDKSVSRIGYKSIDKLTPEGQKVIYRLSAATFVAMMGHFEIYQRSFISGLFDATRFIRSLNIDSAMKKILADSKDNGIRVIDFAAYRGQPAYVGRLLTDYLSGWHDPQRVNTIVKAMLEKIDFYSGKDIEYLNCLWQIRHSIAHTGGWLTLPDAQKVPQLNNMGDRPISFDHNFIRQIHEEFHSIVKSSVGRTAASFRNKIEIDYPKEEANRLLRSKEIKSLFRVDSPRQSQLRSA